MHAIGACMLLGTATLPPASATPLSDAADRAAAMSLLDAADASRIAEIMSALGLSPVLGTDAVGDRMISATMDGQSFSVLFYGCGADGACDSVQFVAVFKGVSLNLDRVNAYNRGWRYGRLAVEADGRLALKFDVNLDGGVTRSNLTDTLLIWREVLANVRRELGLAP